MKTSLSGINNTFRNIFEILNLKGNSFVDNLTSGFNYILNIVSTIEQIFITIKTIVEAIELAKTIFSFFAMAEGGLIRGAGSTTSDSIPIFVSDWEYIIPAEQTKKYLPLLNAIREDKLDKIKFATGGLINSQYLSNIVTYYSQQPYTMPNIYVDIKTEIEEARIQRIYRSTLPKYFKRDSQSKLIKD